MSGRGRVGSSPEKKKKTEHAGELIQLLMATKETKYPKHISSVQEKVFVYKKCDFLIQFGLPAS